MSSLISSFKLKSKLEKTYKNEIINLTENLINNKYLLKNELDKIKHLERKIKDIEKFYQQPNSVSNLIKRDFIKLKKRKITKRKFLEKYGHLRPQTYEINSLNYKEGFNLYFDKKLFSLNSRKTKKAIFKKKIEINHFFKRNLKIM